MFRNQIFRRRFFLFVLSCNFISAAATAKPTNCLDGAPAVKTYLDVAKEKDETPKGNYQVVNSFCQDAMNKENFVQVTENDLVKRSEFSKLKIISASQIKELRSRFEASLAEIQKIADSAEKIRGTYELATGSFPEFNLASSQDELAKLQLYGRQAQQAALLAYSLSQARKKNTEFGLALMTSDASKFDSSHSWVRISLPATKSGAQPLIFDLDPSVTGKKFIPLLKRHQALSKIELASFESQCQVLIKCELERMASEAKK